VTGGALAPFEGRGDPVLPLKDFLTQLKGASSGGRSFKVLPGHGLPVRQPDPKCSQKDFGGKMHKRDSGGLGPNRWGEKVVKFLIRNRWGTPHKNKLCSQVI